MNLSIGNKSEQCNGIATDDYGNTYITGRFYYDSLVFDGKVIKNFNPATQDIFLVKYNANGQMVWAKCFGGDGNDEVTDIIVDESGNCYLTGSFFSSSWIIGNTTLTRLSFSTHLFIIKLDSAGNPLWAKQTDGFTVWGKAIIADNNGSIYITGNAYKNSVFNNDTLTVSGCFIAKYDTSGNFLWVKGTSGNNIYSSYGYAITADDAGNAYVAGLFQTDTLRFDNFVLVNKDSGNADIFIVKYDTNGNVEWARSEGGVGGWEVAERITIDNQQNIYVTGYFKSNTLTIGNTVHLNKGSTDVLIIKYDDNGNLIWSKAIGNSNTEIGYGITVDHNDNIYISGFFGSTTLDFGGTILNLTGGSDMFIAKYDSSGQLLWAKNAGGARHDESIGVTLDRNGNCYMAGTSLSDTIFFDSKQLMKDTADYWCVFIAKLDAATGLPIISTAGNTLNVYPNPANNEITITLNNNIKYHASNLKLFLTDPLGRIILTQNLNPPRSTKQSFGRETSNFKLDINHLANGIYFLTIQTSDRDVHYSPAKIVIN